ncbi:hypothetical protein H257_02569 [Aphanomyces astaci]|uniref:Uncharacterized protein n=1 Tax=Aphanomyces astaci TaxID=112090 RepID=W4H283_APHAT|nr:hypothetical protein H257_02569 [Aphanomyces astaci]ETV86100.1 hypothetical protein H257_02569 [Aphanomyces astaci]|eukprot:XP_009824572.1 hypothetical protein H257_02569 [Aphanomyces astaci]
MVDMGFVLSMLDPGVFIPSPTRSSKASFVIVVGMAWDNWLELRPRFGFNGRLSRSSSSLESRSTSCELACDDRRSRMRFLVGCVDGTVWDKRSGDTSLSVRHAAHVFRLYVFSNVHT